MNKTEVRFADIRRTIRQVPVSNRLEVINDILVNEIECLGYELAHVASPKTVSSVFILASDMGNHIESIHRQLRKEVSQREPNFCQESRTRHHEKLAS